MSWVIPAMLVFAPSVGARTTLDWIVTGSNVRKVNAIHPSLAAYHFDTRRAYVIGNEDGDQDQVPRGFASTPALKYESYARFRYDVTNGKIDRSIRAVIYDPEKWTLTPVAEQENPREYLRRFSRLAHRYGYYAITTPSRDLMAVASAVCRRRSRETLSGAFLRCNIGGAAARYADMYEVQAQVHENDPTTYRSFVQATAAQARAANPRVVVLSGLSTSPWNYVATPPMLFVAHNAVAGLVAGHFLTINARDVATAARFFRRVQAAGR